MIKNSQDDHEKYTLLFFIRLICLCFLIYGFTAHAVDNPGNPGITYRPYHDVDEVDSAAISTEALPESAEALEKMLYNSLFMKDRQKKQIVKKIRQGVKSKKKYVLKIKTLEDANKIFFALRAIYGRMIACDTATVLLTYQLKEKKLSIELIYDFLKARADACKCKKMTPNHPYLVLLSTLIEAAGVKLIDVHTYKPQELADSLLTSVGDTIVLINSKHMSIVTSHPYSFEYSIWNPLDGIFYLNNELGRPAETKFEGSIEQYGFIYKTKVKYRELNYNPFSLMEKEGTDGEDIYNQETLPYGEEELAGRMEEELTADGADTIIQVEEGRLRSRTKKYYLNMQNLEEVNAVFSALKKIYGSQIIPDHCTMLLLYQLSGKMLGIKDLHDLLMAGIDLARGDAQPHKSPYYIYLSRLISRAGVKEQTPETPVDELSEELNIPVNTFMLLTTRVHMSIVKALPNGKYTYSDLSPEGKIIYRTNETGRPEAPEFKANIEKYGVIKLNIQQAD